jgi:hypothetical protein
MTIPRWFEKELKVIAIILAVLFLVACPSGRPTQVVHVCLISGQAAGAYCPPSVVEARKYYVSPQGDEPVPPTEICTAHVKPDDPIDPPDDPIVQVEVCAESDLMPGEWCVDRKTIGVKQSALPLGNCGIHSPPRLPVYVGIYDLLGATGDWRAFLRSVKSNGGKGLRIFGLYAWQGPAPLPLYKQVGTWTHENGMTFPLYRLGTPSAPSWNPAAWDHLAEVLAYCKTLNLAVWLVADDFCSLKGNQTVKYYHPYYSSEEALGPNTPGGVWGDAMRPFYAALFQHLIEYLGASSVDYLFEIANEFDIVDGTDAQVIAWYQWAVDTVIGLGIPKARIVATPGRCAATIAGQVGIYSPHGIGRVDQIKSIAGVAVSKTIFSSDGYWITGGGGGCDAKGRCGPALADAVPLADALIAAGAIGYEWIPRMCYANNNDRSDVSLFDPAFLLRMTRGR